MNFYLAPLEGVTGHVFREAYDLFYGEVNKYFTPFISANDHLNSKTIRELDGNLLKKPLVPQILGNDADKITATISEIRDYCGADTYNLNFGCPSGTVTAKGRGSGILKDLIAMDDMLDKLFNRLEDMGVRLSLKTRIGWADEKEWPDIVRIYADYPFEEIIIHPRVRADHYSGSIKKNAVEYALTHLRVPICYNGDIKTREDYVELCKLFPDISSVMIGRGLVRNPNLCGEIIHPYENAPEIGRQNKYKFIEALEQGYLEEMSCEEHAVMRLKEFWFYFGDSVLGFETEKKDIKKAKTLREYKIAARTIMSKGMQ